MPAEPARDANPTGRLPLPDDGRRGEPTLRLGWAWITLCCAFALHVTDEALTGFLSVYNPTVIALRAQLGWWPMPTFEFREWLVGLFVAIAVAFVVSPLFFRGGRPLRPLAWIVAGVIGVGNGIAHTTGTILGRTVATVHFPRPMPGFWSSPFMIAAGIWMIRELRRTRSARP